MQILDPNLVYDGINLGRRIDVCWPNDYTRLRGGRSYWRDWVPEAGMEGQVSSAFVFHLEFLRFTTILINFLYP